MFYRLALVNPMNKNSKSVDYNQGSDFYTIDEASCMS